MQEEGEPEPLPEPPVSAGPLRVGVAEHPPFARKEADGSWQGLSVNVWRTASEDLGLAYEFVETDQANLLPGVASGELDVALPVIADAEGAVLVDYAFPHYTSTLGIAEARKGMILQTVTRLFSLDFLRIVLSLSVLLLIVGAIIWVIERRGNEDQFSRKPIRGLGDGFWWAGVTLTTIGYGDKAPASFAGRAVAMVWMLVGLAVSAALTAAVVSAMDVSSAGSELGDLRDKSVGVLETDGAGPYLQAKGIETRGFADIESGLDAVKNGDLEAFVHAAPSLRNKVQGLNIGLNVSSTDEEPQHVTFALTRDAPFSDGLETALVRRTTSPGWWEQVGQWVPEDRARQ